MKKVFFSLSILATFFVVIGQAPNAFNYQAILRDAGGKVKSNEAVNIGISILKGADNGPSLYQESHAVLTNSFGLINLIIGEGTTSGDLATIDWSEGPLYIEVKVNGTKIGASQMLSVPYALYAAYGSEGQEGPPGPQGEQGPPGPQGEQGPPGPEGSTSWTEIAGGISYSEGRIGLGTTNPQTLLHIHGNPVDYRGQLTLSAPTDLDVYLSFYENDEYMAYMWWDASDTDLRLQNRTNGDLSLNATGGYVGIGTKEPKFNLTIEGDGGILAKGELNYGEDLTTAESGTRMIWYPRKAAFRAGHVTGDKWSHDNIGYYSVVLGYNSTASGGSSVALNSSNTASGGLSIATGYKTVASGGQSVSMGDETTASGYYSIATGQQTTASGSNSLSMGYKTTAKAYCCLALGRYNETFTGSNSGSWQAGDPVFIIGNGDYLNDHNAVMVKKNGEVYFPDVYADVVGATRRDLYIDNYGKIGYVSSSLQYKNNIRTMEDTDWLYELNPVNFTYLNDESETKQYGLIAEEVEQVNPVFVSYSDEGLPETVSYSQLITPLLKALQEQNELIKALQTRIEILENQ